MSQSNSSHVGFNTLGVTNKLSIPIGQNLSDTNMRTLAPSVGSIAYDSTTNRIYYGGSTDGWTPSSNNIGSTGYTGSPGLSATGSTGLGSTGMTGSPGLGATGSTGNPGLGNTGSTGQSYASVPPSQSKNIYVSKNGSDSLGNGSFALPYATLSNAISLANSLASSNNPMAILISPGLYIENNSVSPLTITSNGISIVSEASSSTIIIPSTASNNLLVSNNTVNISNLSFQSATPLANAITLTAGNLTTLNNVTVFGFSNGIICQGSASSYILNSCVLAVNTIGIVINNTTIQCNNSTITGSTTSVGTPAGTGITISGSSTTFFMSGGSCIRCVNGVIINGNAKATISAVSFKRNIFDILQSGSSLLTLSGASFERTNDSSDVDIQISGSGTTTQIVGCEFNGLSVGGTPQASCILISDNAKVTIDGGTLQNYTTGIQIGLSLDTSSTQLFISGLSIANCVTDILQGGLSTLNVNGATATSNSTSFSHT